MSVSMPHQQWPVTDTPKEQAGGRVGLEGRSCRFDRLTTVVGQVDVQRRSREHQRHRNLGDLDQPSLITLRL
jgi:hypothetical protein